MHMLRPGAKWEISNTTFTRWEDDRPCPTWKEVEDTMNKIKAFEDSIPTIWTKKQIQEMTGQFKQIEKAMDEAKENEGAQKMFRGIDNLFPIPIGWYKNDEVLTKTEKKFQI